MAKRKQTINRCMAYINYIARPLKIDGLLMKKIQIAL